jgi:gamma-glutamylcysteine synthetase
MGKKTFIPNWYIDKKIQGKSKKNKIYIILISIINIVLISLILSNSNKMKNIEQELGNENNNFIIVEAVKPDIISIEKYKELSNFFEVNNLSFKNMIITKGNLEIDIEVKSYEEYIYVVRCIENHYSIKRLAPNIKNEGNFDFKVILEV